MNLANHPQIKVLEPQTRAGVYERYFCWIQFRGCSVVAVASVRDFVLPCILGVRYKWVAKTFVSCEPLVGPLVLQGEHDGKTLNHLGDGGLDWVNNRGESEHNARA